MMASEKISIPHLHQEFCRAVARLCGEHGLTKFNGSFKPPLGDEWQDEITFSWERGRGGADKLFISSTVRVWTRLTPVPPQGV